jgi:hypothetical protein
MPASAPPAPPPEASELAYGTPYALDPTQVLNGANNGPGIYLAPAGTAGPADTIAAWPAAWNILGYASSDGVTVGSSTTTNEIVPWQSIVPLMTVVTQRLLTMKMILWQLNDITLALYFDADPPTPTGTGAASAISMQVRSDKPQHLYAVGLDSMDVNHAFRVIFPRAVMSTAADMTIKRGEAVPLDVTLTALDTAGVLANVLLGPHA